MRKIGVDALSKFVVSIREDFVFFNIVADANTEVDVRRNEFDANETNFCQVEIKFPGIENPVLAV